jgi:protocatechuate 3,4-dioxygenase beta subunit
MKGVLVRAHRTTELDDLLLGDKVVLRGRVIDAAGKPVPGASVSAFRGGGFDFSQGMLLTMVEEVLSFPAPIEEARSDDRGEFALAALVPGTYRLSTRRSGYAMDVKHDLVVAPERAAGRLTIVLGPPAVVRGRVVDERDAPVAGATIVAVEDQGGGMRGFTQSTLRKDATVTGADGRYVLDTLVRGTSYRLGVTAKDRAPAFDAQGTVVDAETVRDFTLALGGSVAGTVSDSATGKPIAGARIVAIVGDLRQMGGMGGRGPRGGAGGGGGSDSTAGTQLATTGEDGAFRLDGLRPGPIAVFQVRARGYSEPAGQALPFMPGATPVGEVRAGETTTLDAKLDPGGTVEGRVTTPGESGPVPLAGAQVAVVSLQSFGGQGPQFPNVFGGYPTGVTDTEGVFKIEGVRVSATFSVVASAPGFVAGNAMDATNQGTMPAEGGTVKKDVTLSSAGVVEGVVADAKGLPVPGARVRTKIAARGGFGAGSWRALLSGGFAGVAISDAEGRYRVENVAGGERMTVEAEADEYVPGESEPFEVTAGEAKRVDVVLSGGATIRGRVIDEHGKTVPGVRLRVGRLDEGTQAMRDLSGWRADSLLEPRIVLSDDAGTFEIGRVRAGRTLLKAEKEGYVTWNRRDLTVAADQVLDSYVISLSKGEAISGVVRGDDGKPLARVTVAATKQASPSMVGRPPGAPAAPADPATEGTVEPSLFSRTDDQGRFAIENVPPGTAYSVVVWMAQGHKGWAQGDEGAIKREVAPGTRDVEFKLAKADPSAPSGFPMPPRPPSATGVPPPTVPPPPPGMR